MDTRHKAAQGRAVQHIPQPEAGAADHRHNQNSPWPDVFQPPTSSKKAVWTAVKAWMTGTSPVKGTWSCSRVSANIRLLSTGQPWHKAVRMSPELHRRVAAARSGKSVNTFVAETLERFASDRG